MGETGHLSRYRLVAAGGDVVWRVSAEEAVDLTGRPGQQVIAAMLDILGAFRNEQDQGVVPLYRPKPGVSVYPSVEADVARGAVAFARYVDGYRGVSTAA